jgi:WD40 repeat protein
MVLHFGNLDKSIRKYHASGRVSRKYEHLGVSDLTRSTGSSMQLTGIIENTDASVAVFVNPTLLAAANRTGIISLWKIQATNASVAPMANTQFNIDALLRGHQGEVNSMATSDTWSTLVSCGNEGMAVIWDMNRKRFLHRVLVEPEEPVRYAAINESEVSVCEGQTRV